MQRYKCNTKEKKNIFVGRIRGRRMVNRGHCINVSTIVQTIQPDPDNNP